MSEWNHEMTHMVPSKMTLRCYLCFVMASMLLAINRPICHFVWLTMRTCLVLVFLPQKRTPFYYISAPKSELYLSGRPSPIITQKHPNVTKKSHLHFQIAILVTRFQEEGLATFTWKTSIYLIIFLLHFKQQGIICGLSFFFGRALQYVTSKRLRHKIAEECVCQLRHLTFFPLAA